MVDGLNKLLRASIVVVVCRSFKGYEEVSVPAVKPAAPPPGEELVKISEMEEWQQLPFAGYK